MIFFALAITFSISKITRMKLT